VKKSKTEILRQSIRENISYLRRRGWDVYVNLDIAKRPQSRVYLVITDRGERHSEFISLIDLLHKTVEWKEYEEKQEEEYKNYIKERYKNGTN